MKLFDRIKKRKHLELYEKDEISVKVNKSNKNKISFATDLEEENDGQVQLLGEKDGTIYLISSIGTKDIKYKKSYLRHFDLFERERIGNLFYGISISEELKNISDSLSNELKKGINEEDILYRKEIMKQLLVSSLKIQNDGSTRIVIYAPTYLDEIINFKCDDKKVGKIIRNIGEKLSEMSEEERFILFINCIKSIFEVDDEKITEIVEITINELVENKYNGKQSKLSNKQIEAQERQDKINFINLSVKEKYETKRKIEEDSDFQNSDITYLISIKTGTKICLSTFPIKDVEYKSNLRKLLNNMFYVEKPKFQEYGIKTELLLYSLLDIDTLIGMLEYIPEWLYEHDPKYSPSYHLSRGTKGYYATNEIDKYVLDKYNSLVEDVKKIKTREDYIEFYTKYMNKLIDYIKGEYEIEDEYQLYLLDQFIEKCLAEIIEKADKIPYDSIRKLKTYEKDELKDLFYKRKKSIKLISKLSSLNESKNRKEEEKRQKEEKIKKEMEERKKEKMIVISNAIATKTSLVFNKNMTIDDIKSELLKHDPKFTEEELGFCTGLVLRKSSQILKLNKKKKLKFKWWKR